MASARRHTLALILPLALAATAAPWVCTRTARAERMLVTYDEAARLGLERAWFAQTPVDAARSRVTTWFHYFDAIYCVSDSGIISAINSETGAHLWSRRIGTSGLAAFGPDANKKYLACVSGTTLYMLDRFTGRIKWSQELGGAPTSGAALTRDYAFVALATGRIEAYKISDPHKQPWYYQSKGHTYFRPTATGNIVSWPTSEGYLYVSRANQPGVLFRLATNDDIVTSPAEQSPYLYIASQDGYLYCLQENTGREKWRFATGYPVTSSPAVVGDHVYVASMEPMIHCLDATTGVKQWSVAGVSHFAAQGKDRVYASDRYGNFVVIDTKTGSVLGNLRTAEGCHTLVNDTSDRIFLVNDRGLVQCLREIGATEPTYYRKPIEEEEPKKDAKTKPGEENPFSSETPAPAEGETPFQAEPAAPAQQPPAQPAQPAAPPDNPFGGADAFGGGN